MAAQRLKNETPVAPERLNSLRAMGVHPSKPAVSNALKALWADPEWRAAQLVKHALGQAKRTDRYRLGVPDGMRKRDADKAWARAKEQAEQTMAELKDAGALVDKTVDDARAEEALKDALEVMRSPLNQKIRLSAASLVLKYTKSPPPTKTELAISEAEAWLKQVAKDNDGPSGDAEEAA